MEIKVAKDELQQIRDIIYAGMRHYAISKSMYNKAEMLSVAEKLIRKINSGLKSVYGHDCNGDAYLK